MVKIEIARHSCSNHSLLSQSSSQRVFTRPINAFLPGEGLIPYVNPGWTVLDLSFSAVMLKTNRWEGKNSSMLIHLQS